MKKESDIGCDSTNWKDIYRIIASGQLTLGNTDGTRDSDDYPTN